MMGRRQNVLRRRFGLWRQAASAAADVERAVARSWGLRVLRAAMQRWRIGAVAQVWREPEAESPASAAGTVDLRARLAPLAAAWSSRQQVDVDSWLSWIKDARAEPEPEPEPEMEISDGANDPPGGCRLPLRHGNADWRARSCSPQAERQREAASAKLQEKMPAAVRSLLCSLAKIPCNSSDAVILRRLGKDGWSRAALLCRLRSSRRGSGSGIPSGCAGGRIGRAKV